MTEPFKREDRYIVIKRKHLVDNGDGFVEWLERRGIKQVPQAVVVEGDWPEYEPVWRSIEERVSRADRPLPTPTELPETTEEFLEAAIWALAELADRARHEGAPLEVWSHALTLSEKARVHLAKSTDTPKAQDGLAAELIARMRSYLDRNQLAGKPTGISLMEQAIDFLTRLRSSDTRALAFVDRVAALTRTDETTNPDLENDEAMDGLIAEAREIGRAER